MQRGDPALVERIRIGTSRDEQLDDAALCAGVPSSKPRTAICRVVQGLSTPAVTGVHVSSRTEENTSHLACVRRSGNMKQRVTRVDVVLDVAEVEGCCRMSCRPDG